MERTAVSTGGNWRYSLSPISQVVHSSAWLRLHVVNLEWLAVASFGVRLPRKK